VITGAMFTAAPDPGLRGEPSGGRGARLEAMGLTPRPRPLGGRLSAWSARRGEPAASAGQGRRSDQQNTAISKDVSLTVDPLKVSTVGPDDVAEGDRIFASHGEFMKGHPRDGDLALLDYSISKGRELSNPMDPSSEPTGNTIVVVDERYASPAGIVNHWQDTTANRAAMSSAAPAWFEKATIVTLHDGASGAEPAVQGNVGLRVHEAVRDQHPKTPRPGCQVKQRSACDPKRETSGWA
jgi:hypothetical protein